MKTLTDVGQAARSGDRDRFDAALFEDDPQLRERLFTLIAFNAELARTRFRASEPHIGLIRLQWWRDAVAEAAEGEPPRAHELAAPVSALVKAAPMGFPGELGKLIDAWERDLDPAPFASLEALCDHIHATAGRMMRLGGMLTLGRRPNAVEEAALAGCGAADGAARVLSATAALAAENRSMLPLAGASLASLLRGEPDAEAKQAARALGRFGAEALAQGEARAAQLDGETQAQLKPVLLARWRAERVLKLAQWEGGDLLRDLGPESPFRRRASLLWRGVFARF